MKFMSTLLIFLLTSCAAQKDDARRIIQQAGLYERGDVDGAISVLSRDSEKGPEEYEILTFLYLKKNNGVKHGEGAVLASKVLGVILNSKPRSDHEKIYREALLFMTFDALGEHARAKRVFYGGRCLHDDPVHSCAALCLIAVNDLIVGVQMMDYGMKKYQRDFFEFSSAAFERTFLVGLRTREEYLNSGFDPCPLGR